MRLRILSLLLLSSVITMSVASERGLLNALPENIDFLIHIKDTQKFINHLKKNPILQIDENIALKKRFINVLRLIKQPSWQRIAEEVYGYPIDELFALFDKEMVISSDDANASLNLMIGIADENKIIEVLKNRFDYFSKNTEEGEQYVQESEQTEVATINTIYKITDEVKAASFSWAILEQILFINQNNEKLQQIISGYLEKQGETWFEKDVHKRFRNNEQYDWLGYVNAKKIIHLVSKQWGDKSNKNEQMQVLLSLLESIDYDAFYLRGVTLEKQTTLDLILAHQESSWLAKMTKTDTGNLHLPNFVNDDAVSVTMARIDINRLWTSILALSEQFEYLKVYVPILQTQLQSFSDKTGVDIENAITDGVGSTYYATKYVAEENNKDKERDELYVINLEDSDTVLLAINAILKSLMLTAMVEKQEFLDIPIYRYNPGQSEESTEKNYVYSIFNDLLFVADNLNVLKQALTRLKSDIQSHQFKWSEKMETFITSQSENITAITYEQSAHYFSEKLKLLEALQNIVIPAPKQECSTGISGQKVTEKQSENNKNLFLEVFEGYYNAVITTSHQFDDHLRLSTLFRE